MSDLKTMNKTVHYVLLAALFLMPAAATLLHMKLHANVSWLLWVTLFDAIVVTALLVKKSTVEYGFYLNSLLALSGLYHFFIKPDLGIVGMIMYGLTDVMFVAVDFLIGLAIYLLLTQESKPEQNPSMQ